MRIVFYSASTSAHSNSSTKTTYQPFRADTWDEMDRLYPDCEFVVAGPLNGSYIFDVADGEICKKPEKVKYVLLESGMSAEDTAELIAQQRPDIAVAIASGAVPFDWVPIKTALIAEELQKRGIATIANNLVDKHKGQTRAMIDGNEDSTFAYKDSSYLLKDDDVKSINEACIAHFGEKTWEKFDDKDNLIRNVGLEYQEYFFSRHRYLKYMGSNEKYIKKEDLIEIIVPTDLIYLDELYRKHKFCLVGFTPIFNNE